MTDILHATTQVLDLLVPLSDAERTRVLSAARAVIDLSGDRGGFKAIAEGPIDKGTMVAVMDSGPPMNSVTYSPKGNAKEKPARRAPKGRRQRGTVSRETCLKLAQGPNGTCPTEVEKQTGMKRCTAQFHLQKLANEGLAYKTGKNNQTRYHAGTTQ